MFEALEKRPAVMLGGLFHDEAAALLLTRPHDLDGEVVGFELDLAPLAARDVPRAGELSRFPSVRRDIALVVPETTPWAALEASLQAALGGLLREVVLFESQLGWRPAPDMLIGDGAPRG